MDVLLSSLPYGQIMTSDHGRTFQFLPHKVLCTEAIDHKLFFYSHTGTIKNSFKTFIHTSHFKTSLTWNTILRLHRTQAMSKNIKFLCDAFSVLILFTHIRAGKKTAVMFNKSGSNFNYRRHSITHVINFQFSMYK